MLARCPIRSVDPDPGQYPAPVLVPPIAVLAFPTAAATDPCLGAAVFFEQEGFPLGHRGLWEGMSVSSQTKFI